MNERKQMWWEKENPYEVVREEATEEECCDGRRITTIGYDAKNRKVMQRTEVFHPNGSHGIMCYAVEADGYWHGGVTETDAEGNYSGGCAGMPRKFDENEE